MYMNILEKITIHVFMLVKDMGKEHGVKNETLIMIELLISMGCMLT